MQVGERRRGRHGPGEPAAEAVLVGHGEHGSAGSFVRVAERPDHDLGVRRTGKAVPFAAIGAASPVTSRGYPGPITL